MLIEYKIFLDSLILIMNKVRGTIVDKISNSPIYEAVILLNNVKLPSNDIAQLSNKKGIFKWVNLEVGEYTIQIIAESYKSEILNFRCEMNSEINLEILLESKI